MSTTRRRRPALIALVIVAAAGCLALAWWQWTRFESASGSFQNLGYALQWPLFAGFWALVVAVLVSQIRAETRIGWRQALSVLVDSAQNAMPVALYALAVATFAIGTTEFVVVGLIPGIASDLGVSIPAA